MHKRRFDEAITEAEKAVSVQPNFFVGHISLSNVLVFSGSPQEAQEILRIDPQFSVDTFADRIPYKNQSDTDRILNALRKAGLK